MAVTYVAKVRNRNAESWVMSVHAAVVERSAAERQF